MNITYIFMYIDLYTFMSICIYIFINISYIYIPVVPPKLSRKYNYAEISPMYPLFFRFLDILREVNFL